MQYIGEPQRLNAKVAFVWFCFCCSLFVCFVVCLFVIFLEADNKNNGVRDVELMV